MYFRKYRYAWKISSEVKCIEENMQEYFFALEDFMLLNIFYLGIYRSLNV